MIAVVGYPTLNETDRQWIEAFRARHDPQARRIPVHFTLVFPLEIALSRHLEGELAAAARSAEPVSFAVRRTEVVPDVVRLGSVHVFLVPDEGSGPIAALHEKLYAGALRPYLRTDIPFVPHMTVAEAADSSAAWRLAGQLDIGSRVVRGTLNEIDLVEVGEQAVKSVGTYILGCGGVPRKNVIPAP